MDAAAAWRFDQDGRKLSGLDRTRRGGPVEICGADGRVVRSEQSNYAQLDRLRSAVDRGGLVRRTRVQPAACRDIQRRADSRRENFAPGIAANLFGCGRRSAGCPTANPGAAATAI